MAEGLRYKSSGLPLEIYSTASSLLFAYSRNGGDEDCQLPGEIEQPFLLSFQVEAITNDRVEQPGR